MILLETVVAGLVGMAGLWLVLEPLLGFRRRAPPAFDPLDPEETPRGIALAALKEIDFDRETGKLSDSDYNSLKAKYTRAALDALRNESNSIAGAGADSVIPARVPTGRKLGAQPNCGTCGPRPEPDAIFCSSCGRRIVPAPPTETAPLPGTTRTPASA